MSHTITVTVNPIPDHAAIVSQELQRAAQLLEGEWKRNLMRGTGALGSHGRPYRATGETINRTVTYPREPGHMAYAVVGETIAHLIAEFGRRPGAKMPPHAAIAEWCRVQGLIPNEGESFDDMVLAIRRHIAAHGLRAFAPCQLAVQAIAPTVEPAIRRRIAEQPTE